FFLTYKYNIKVKHYTLEKLLTYTMLCNDAQLFIQKGKYVIDGDPTDGAMLIAARKYGISNQLTRKFDVMKRIPFDSIRKRMNVIVKDENGREFMISKGAPEVIIPRCTYYAGSSSRQLLHDTTNIDEKIAQMTGNAQRVIAISIKPLNEDDTLK